MEGQNALREQRVQDTNYYVSGRENTTDHSRFASLMEKITGYMKKKTAGHSKVWRNQCKYQACVKRQTCDARLRRSVINIATPLARRTGGSAAERSKLVILQSTASVGSGRMRVLN